jgi:hypothetical protein
VATQGDASVVRGIVILVTDPGLASALQPVNTHHGPEYENENIRFATEAAAALQFAGELFAVNGITPPALTLD